MLADELDYVIGVDTPRDEHVLAVVVPPAGAVVAGEVVRAHADGYRQALRCHTEIGDKALANKTLLLLLNGLLAKRGLHKARRAQA
jgi:hypothetical protein